MQRLRSVRYRIYPNAKQQALLVSWLNLHRDLYNAALEQRLYAWKRSRTKITYADQVSALPKIKTYFPEYLNCGDKALCATLQRVEAVCNKFYAKSRMGMRVGFPRFKSSRRFDSINYAHAHFRIRRIKKRLWKIDIPNIGSLRARGLPRVDIAKGNVQSMIIRVKNNCWEILLFILYRLVDLRRECAVIGTRLGIRAGSVGATDDLIATSDGYAVKFPPDILKLQKASLALSTKMKYEQPTNCRERGVLRKLLSTRKSLFQKRRDFLQQVTTIFASRYEFITIARSKFSGVSKDYREFICSTISLFCFTLVYKAEEAGGQASVLSAVPYKGDVVTVAKTTLMDRLKHTGQELAEMPIGKPRKISNSA